MAKWSAIILTFWCMPEPEQAVLRWAQGIPYRWVSWPAVTFCLIPTGPNEKGVFDPATYAMSLALRS